MQSFNAAKSKIISSALGAALGLTANTPLADVAAKVAAVVNRGTLNWSGSNTTFAVPAGYYPGGTLDSRPSYNAGVTAADNRANVNSVNYKTGYNAGVLAGKAASEVVHLSTQVVTDTNSTVSTIDIPANSGTSYGILIFNSRRNSTAEQVRISNVTTNNGALTKITESATSAPVTSSSIWNTHIQVFTLKKSSAGSVARITITSGHKAVEPVVIVYSAR